MKKVPARITQEQIQALAQRTEDAFSFERYASWSAVAAALLRRGYTEPQTEEIMRSKIMRWAADHRSAHYGRATANDLLRFIDKQPDAVPSLLREASLAS